jgi:hypothetical protein
MFVSLLKKRGLKQIQQTNYKYFAPSGALDEPPQRIPSPF